MKMQTSAYKLLVAASIFALVGCSPAGTGSGKPAETEQDADVETLNVGDMPGPVIGDPAPVDIALKTSKGDETKLLDLAGEKGIVIAFTRSVDWCPYCQGQLKSLKDISQQVEASGYTLVGLSYDSPEDLSKFIEAQGINYPLLSDQGSKLIDAFAIRDPQYTEGRAKGVPFASIFVLDTKGNVLAKSVSSDYKVRPSNEEVLKMLQGLSS